MSAFSSLKFNFYVLWKKILRRKFFFLFLAGFILFLALFWWQGDFTYARRFFFYLFPYLFLLMAQDIFREEIDSGCLENVLFLQLNFRRYLFEKNLSLLFLGIVFSCLLFLPFLIGSIIRQEFSWSLFFSFFMGLLAGFYYLTLATGLGLKLRAGSNVLVVIVVQVFLFLSLFVGLTSLSSGRDLIDLLLSASPQNSREKLLLFFFVAFWPNALVSRSYSSLSLRLEILFLIIIFLGLQAWRLSRLELKRE